MPKNDKILIAFLLGAAAGAVLGILFAPDSGENSRRKIKKWKEDMENELSSVYEQGKEKVNDLKSKMKNHSDEKGDEANNMA